MIDLSPDRETRIQVTPRLLVRDVADGAVVSLATGDAFCDEPVVVRVNRVVHDVLRALEVPRTTSALVEHLQDHDPGPHPGDHSLGGDGDRIIAEVVSELCERGWVREC